MVRTRQTASVQLLRTPWTLRRKHKIWLAKRTKAALSSTGCSEQWSKKLRVPCDGGYCWKEPHINWRTPECRSRTSRWTPTTVRWMRSLARSEKLTFLPLVPQQKEEKTWTCSIVLQATTLGTRGVCWNTRVL